MDLQAFRDSIANSQPPAGLSKEGDQSNAEYWYRRCDAAPSTLTLDEEWQELARDLLRQV
ncbi:hypothetical protein [Mesorhizobium sp.]|uniref:hypothetical protein n=1 Tax=Mesorhizobium sp. TaxID=1871066 RepID=UPI0012206D63|nr:hypothetical protein [Mesorhizobium sp.]TIL68252.1 MAG: hypothetical protein E5Y77_07615 [Mesorhizobium sp.]